MRNILMASTAVVAIACSAPALAQVEPAAKTEAENSGEIIVSARRREESLLNVPLPVSVATKEMLERAQIQGISDLQRLTPALEISQSSGGESSGGARIRGLGTGVFNHSVSPSVAFVIDEVSQGNLSFPLLFDLKQVEVLRGPQGTLFGQGASAGVIKIATGEPTADAVHVEAGFELAGKGIAGSEFGNQIARGSVNIPLGEIAAFRIASQYTRELGLQRNVTTGKDNKITDFGVRAKLLLTPGPNTKIHFAGEYAKRSENAWNFFATSLVPTLVTSGNAAAVAEFNACGVTPSPRAEQYCSNFPGYTSRRAWGVSAVIEQGIGDSLNLTSVTAYRTFNNYTRSVDYGRLVNGAAANRENIQDDSKQFNQELRLAFKGNGFDVIVGGLYQKYSYLTSPALNGPFNVTTPGNRIGFSVCPYNGNFTIPFGPMGALTNFGCVPFVYGIGKPTVRFEFEDTKNSTYAAFADATVKLSDDLDLFGGVRYTRFSNTTGVAFDATSAPAKDTYTIKDNNVSGRVGITYRPSSTSSLYASFARGYKPLAVTLTPGNLVPVFLKPEDSSAFEFGARAQAGRILFSGNIFSTKIKNFQAQTQVTVAGQLLSAAKNVEAIKSYGFEVSASGKLTDNLTLNAGYQFNIATYPTGYCGDDDVDANLDGVCDGNLSNRQVTNAPVHKFTLAGEYTFPLSDKIEGFLNSNLVYKSAVRISAKAAPEFTFGAHAIVNMAIGVRDPDDKWNFSIFARNLTKQREPLAYLGTLAAGFRAWPGAGLTARIVGITGGVSF